MASTSHCIIVPALLMSK
jgi:hypothetical protein